MYTPSDALLTTSGMHWFGRLQTVQSWHRQMVMMSGCLSGAQESGKQGKFHQGLYGGGGLSQLPDANVSIAVNPFTLGYTVRLLADDFIVLSMDFAAILMSLKHKRYCINIIQEAKERCDLFTQAEA